MAVLNRCYEGLYLAVVALRIDLIVGERWSEVVAGIEVFDSSIMSVNLLVWDAKDGGRFWLEDQFFHLKETVDALRCADFEGFFSRSPGVGGGEFESADDVWMTEHEDIGRWGYLLAGDDFWFAKEIGDKVERMDEKVEQSVTFWIVACEEMEVITDKMLFAQTFLKDLHGRGIAFLQSNHCYGGAIKSLLVYEGIKFL